MGDQALSTTRRSGDPDCPYAWLAQARPDTFHHVCRRRDGRVVVAGEADCFAKAELELRIAAVLGRLS